MTASAFAFTLGTQPGASVPAPPPAPATAPFIEKYCAGCHDDVEKAGGLDLASLQYAPGNPANFAQWVKVHDRLQAGEMPPIEKKRPDASDLEAFVKSLATSLTAHERETVAREGRATQRRLNGYEYENALRDLLGAPWLQVKSQLPEDAEAFRYNKIGDVLDFSHVHVARYMKAADYALREVIGVRYVQPKPTTRRFYAREQRTLTSKFKGNFFISVPDRMTFPVLGLSTAQPEVRWLRAPVTVGDADPVTRELEAVGWVASVYATGFIYRWDQFRAPIAGRYRVRFSGHTLWLPPGGIHTSYKDNQDKVGRARPPNPNYGDYDHPQPGRRHEPITVYTRDGIMNRRVGEFDLTPEPAVHEMADVWLLANETLVPDASRFFRSRGGNYRNPLMTPEGAPGVAFRWMEVEGPLYDDATTAGFRLLFGDLTLAKVAAGQPGIAIPLGSRKDRRDPDGRNAGQQGVPVEEIVELVSADPKTDAARLLRGFMAKAYRRPVNDTDLQPFIALVDGRRAAGMAFVEAMVAGYTAVLASPGFVFVEEKPGRLDPHALATRLALFLWNSLPDDRLRVLAANGSLEQPDVLRGETERMLNDAKAVRFHEAFLDYWLDLRKIEDSTPSATLYNDYSIDDALAEAAHAETRLFFAELVRRDLPARHIIHSDFTFLNERLASHYGIPDVTGIAMRRVPIPAGNPRGGFMTQASVLKITANGTTTSPVLRGKWILERILGIDIPPPPPVAAVEPDIRGAVTIRQQLEKHRADASCASCHSKMDPPGFALESFDIMGGWRDRYRGLDKDKPAEKGIGKNGQPFGFHFGLPVDSSGELPDGRTFRDINEFKQLLRDQDAPIARNLVKQLIVYATGAPVRFSDRDEIEKILERVKVSDYGVRTIVHEIVQSELFRSK